ncbi:MAG: hypothetical protein PHI11_10010 [Gallionella sp.]|nr:hypothetical protein [Gallionella sp.]
MEVYKSKYLHIAFFAEQSLMELTWLSESKMMDTQDCKQEMLNYADVVRKLHPKRIVLDVRTMFFTFSSELQNWIDQTIIPSLLASGMRWVAFVVGDDFFVVLSTKQVMAEQNGIKFTTQYFDSKDAAKKWLLSAA